MLDNYEIMEKVQALVEESGLDVAEIARRSGESEKKVRQILSEGKNPSFTPLCGIITACGGSVDKIIGAAPTSAQTSPSNDGLVIQLRSDLRYERRKGRTGWVLFVCMVAIAVAVLLIDLANPQFGWVRYEMQRQSAVGEQTAYSVLCRALAAIGEIIL